MKFGQTLQSESVPRWRIHNIDYNSLKHEIKVHTTKGQAKAIPIAGHEDVNLARFENGFYNELLAQHERVGDFVASKTDEIRQRLSHTGSSIQCLIARYPSNEVESLGIEVVAKRQRRLSKYEHELLKCSDDLHSLNRFINAQVVAFRKILKKYQKWTGSSNLITRFRENVLSDPKSFTRCDLSFLQTQYDNYLHEFRETIPEDRTIGIGSPETISSASHQGSSNNPTTPPCQIFSPLPPPNVHYWNEYDDGSEAGDRNDDYAIYINPDDDFEIPGLEFIRNNFVVPFSKAKNMFTLHTLGSTLGERAPLLGVFASNGRAQVSDTDDDYTSSDEQLPNDGYATHYAAFPSAFPSVSEQRALRQRDQMFMWVMVGSFVVSFVLIAITSTLIATGRHKLRLEVEAGVTVGIITSLFSGCVGLGMMMVRENKIALWHHVVLWMTFISVCVLNGLLLLLIMEW